ncbi:MAG: hypothetical protein IT285_13080 [Bdellovibrionales bacterium]|nr:hypothetical protein [Bdellovibrionales bacterium]
MKLQPFEEHLLVLHQGKNATIYRPNVYLFLMLKLGRLTASDLSDCLALIKREGLPPMPRLKTLQKRVRAEIQTPESPERLSRLRTLLTALSSG